MRDLQTSINKGVYNIQVGKRKKKRNLGEEKRPKMALNHQSDKERKGWGISPMIEDSW